MTFFVIAYFSFRAGMSLHNGQPSILRTIMEDSTVYFFVIFSAHLLSLITVAMIGASSTIILRRSER